MKYQLMESPLKGKDFVDFTKKEAKIYFEWYLSEFDNRMEQLDRYIKATSNKVVQLDYTVESLIPLWDWFEDNIFSNPRTEEEVAEEMTGKPEWMRPWIAESQKIELITWAIAMDIAIYFGEVFRKNNSGIKWGHVTKPKSHVSYNRPVLYGFVGNVAFDTRLIVKTCTRKSTIERDSERLFNLYYKWIRNIDESVLEKK